MVYTPNKEDMLHGVAELDDDRSRGIGAKTRGDCEVALFGTVYTFIGAHALKADHRAKSPRKRRLLSTSKGQDPALPKPWA